MTSHPRRSSSTLCMLLGCVVWTTACAGPKLRDKVAPLDVLQLLPQSSTLQVGDAISLGALRLQGGESRNLTSSVTWTSSDEQVVSVSYSATLGAVATGVAPGSAYIEARDDGGATARAAVVVVAEITRIELDKSARELAQGSELALGSIGIAADGSKRAVKGSATWASSAPEVASVDDSGVVSGVSAGAATITLVQAGHIVSTPVQVSAWTLDSLELRALAGHALPISASTSLEVIGHFAGGRTQDLTRLFTFEVQAVAEDQAGAADSEPVLTVDEATVTAGSAAGMATVVGAGKPGSIAAGKQLQLDFSVSDAALMELSLDAPMQLSTQGEVGSFVLTAIHEDGLRFETKGEFATDPDGIVEVDAAAGTITPLAPGTTQITASVGAADDESGEASAAIEVTRDISVVDAPLSGLTIEPPSSGGAALTVGGSLQLTATAAFGAVSQDVTEPALWSSADERIAAVSNVVSGTVAGLARGTTTISAAYHGRTATFSIVVSAAR